METTLPISMLLVRRNDSSANRASAQANFPFQWGTTGLVLDFCVSVDKCA